MSLAGFLCLPSRASSPSAFDEVQWGDWGPEVWLGDLPLFCSEVMDGITSEQNSGDAKFAGLLDVADDLEETLHVYTAPKHEEGEWLATEESQPHPAKRRRADAVSNWVPAPVPAPPAPSPHAALPPSSRYINAAWATELVGALGGLTCVDEEEWTIYLVDAFGSKSGSSGPRKDAVRKVVLMDRLLLALSHETCQDTRLAADIARSPLVVPELLADDAAPLRRFLRPFRSFRVNDPLAFNLAFRALQASHPEWPRVRGTPEGTKGITQPLTALGFGPPKTAPWGVRNLGLRGPVDTDPEKELTDDGRWVTRVGKRDGLYYRHYVFEAERVTKRANAAHIFKTLPRVPM